MHKSGLRVLGVALLAAFSLTALFAASAQAENLKTGGVAGNFRVEGKSELVAGTTFTGVQEEAGKLLIDGKNAFIECAKGEVAEGVGLSSSEIKVKVLFKECVTREDSGTFPILTACPVKEVGGAEGMVTANAIGKAKLHESNLYILFEGIGAEHIFTEIEFSELCSLGFKVKIKESVVAKVVNGNLEEVNHLIEFNKAITELFQIVNGSTTEGDQLKFGSSQALVIANFKEVHTTGIHLGKTWSVI